MDRRLFLTGMLGVAGAAALAGLSRPGTAFAAAPNAGRGILDELDSPETEFIEETETPAAEPVQYYGRRRRRRRRVWRRVCRRYWNRGRMRVRCRRRRVWVRLF